MSAVAGYFCRDGRPAARGKLAGMLDTLAHRGSDGSGMWVEGSVGFGHQMTWVTPESIGEYQPLVRRNRELAITADVRLDNRKELLDLLGWSDRPAHRTTDSELILGAYEAWGERCSEHLLGDFSFVVWDGRRQQLFCARDHMGARPLYYYCSEDIFVFSSEIKGILALPRVPRRLNEARVGYHLQPELLFADRTITFYQGIRRLAPAHTMTVTRERVAQHHYWSLDIHRELRMGSDDEYAEAFRDLFTEAVRCRLRSAYPVGSTLSGGLDSSSIACAARDLVAGNGNGVLHTFSAVFDKFSKADESEYSRAIVAQGSVVAHFTHPDHQSPLTDLEFAFQQLDEAFWCPNYALPLAVYQEAAAHGVRVVLDGADGDTTVSHGTDYVIKLAHTEQWGAFAAEARAVVQRFDDPSSATELGILRSFGAPYLSDLARAGQWVALLRGVNQLGREFGTSRRRLLVDYGVKAAAPESVRCIWRRLRGRHETTGEASFLNPDFARRFGLVEQLDELESAQSSLPWTERTDHFQLLELGSLPYSLELMSTLSGGLGVETRYPFCDRRLIEFCLALPPEQKLREGWSRWVMRRAMEGILPPKVQWRGGKGTLSPLCNRGLKQYERSVLDEVILGDDSGLDGYVDMDTLRFAYRRYLERELTEDLVPVWLAVSLALWLRHENWEN